MRSRFAAVAALLYGACACAAPQIAPGTFLVEGEATPNRQPDCNVWVFDPETRMLLANFVPIEHLGRR